jgi:hypothetical protein
MREYALTKQDGTVLLNLNDPDVDSQPALGSFTLGSDQFGFDNRLVENSAIPGAIKLGITRVESREIILRFVRAHPADSDFRTAENNLIENLLLAYYLKDITNNLRVPIAILDYNLAYDPGGYQESSENEVSIRFLDPFWETITATNKSQALTTDLNTVSITNSGKLPVPPVITFTASVAVTSLDIYIDSTKEGIQISDSLFGTSIYTTLIINCIEGTIDLVGFDRTKSIVPGTGYFEIPTGVQDLMVLVSAACNISMDWRHRWHI